MAAPKGAELCEFAGQVIRGRWFSVFATLLVMAGAGATYLFGTYSKEIKKTLGYDQTTLNLLGFFKDLGASIGVLSGLLAEVTPTWFVLVCGAAMNFFGYFMIWLAVTGKIAKPAVWQMCLYICIGANSQNFANTGALVTCVKNFPEGRGVMLGLLKGFVGLSGAVMTQIYLAVYGTDSKSLILLIGWLPAVISLLFVYTVREIGGTRQKNEEKVFYKLLYVSIVMALFLMVVTVLEKQFVFPKAAYAASATIACLFMFVPLVVVVKEELALWDAKKKKESQSGSVSPIVPAPKPTGFPKHQTPWNKDIFKPPPRGEDYTILQALLSLDMWILFLATFCGLGSALTAVDNFGQIGESLGYSQQVMSSFLSLVSIWNFFGRIFAGCVSEIFIKRFRLPRPLMMTLILVLASIGYLIIAFPIPGSLYIASIILGFCLGANLPLLYAIISELFGLKYYSTLFNCGQMALPLGSYVLNVKVTGILYDNEAARQLRASGQAVSAGKELTCMGPHCYRSSFIILTLVTLFGALVTLVLVMRTRKFYSGDIYAKFRDSVEGSSEEELEHERRENRKLTSGEGA